jgi:hypothetical protein
LVGKSEEGRSFGTLGVDKNIILKWMLNRTGGFALDLYVYGYGAVVGYCEHGS